MPLLTLQVALSLSLLALLLALSAALVPFFLAFEFGLLSLLFFPSALFPGDTLLLLFNGRLLSPELLSHPFALGLLGGGVGSILFVRLGAALLLFVGEFRANFGSPGLPDASLDCGHVNQLPNDVFRLVVDS
jgi:hypothetical protein